MLFMAEIEKGERPIEKGERRITSYTIFINKMLEAIAVELSSPGTTGYLMGNSTDPSSVQNEAAHGNHWRSPLQTPDRPFFTPVRLIEDKVRSSEPHALLVGSCMSVRSRVCAAHA